ncbi:MAG: tetratricopeptide repeat protein [Hyphomicrobiales bacterium]
MSLNRFATIVALFLCLGGFPHVRAQEAPDKALLHASEGAAALLRGQYEKAIVAYDEALKSPKLTDARKSNILNDRGVALWRLKRYAEAIADFNKAIELFSDFAMVFNNRGNVLMELGRYEEALADFNRAVTLAPGYGAGYNNRGNAYMVLKKYEEAFQDYNRAVALMGTNAVPFNGRGKANAALGRPYAALRDYGQALTLNAKYGGAHSNRATVYASLERHDDAVTDLTEAISVSPELVPLYLARAKALAEIRKTNTAMKDLDKAVELQPNQPGPYIARGQLLLTLGSPEKAREDLTTAANLDNTSADAFAYRAQAYQKLGQPEEAMADANLAIELRPDNADYLRIRAELHEAQGRPQEAMADYQAALAAAPGDKAVRAAMKKLGAEPPVTAEAVAIGPEVSGWIVSESSGRFVATNSKYPKLRVLLEMYGEGKPQILGWQVLKYELQGIGLLHYFSGNRADGQKTEYVAIVDLWSNKVLAVEPEIWGNSHANWEWRQVSVAVTDPDGITNEVRLRKPRPEEQVENSDPWFGSGGLFGGPSSSGGRRPRGIFDWLFR